MYTRCYVQHTYLVLINLSLTISAAASYDEVGIDEIEIERVVRSLMLYRDTLFKFLHPLSMRNNGTGLDP